MTTPLTGPRPTRSTRSKASSERTLCSILAVVASAMLLLGWAAADPPLDLEPAGGTARGAGAVADVPKSDPDGGQPTLLRLFLDELAELPPALAALDGATRAELTRAIDDFYRERGDRVAWIDGKELSPRGRRLLDGLGAAEQHGLEPADYGRQALETRAAVLATRRGPVLREQLQLELDLAGAFALYASDLAHGRLDPGRFGQLEWHVQRESLDLARTLQVLARGATGGFDQLAPRRPEYDALVDALARYREIEANGGWMPLEDAEAPAPEPAEGTPVEVLRALAHRLRAEGDLTSADAERLERVWARADSFVFPYPHELEEAVRRFQRRVGLDDDGRVGEKTRAALDVGVEDRIEQLALNLERLRWLPDPAERRILVNVPQFELTAYDSGQPALTMRVVAGRPSWRTPSFTERMTHLVLNPVWNVPTGIAGNEVVPATIDDAAYLDQENMELVERETGRVVDSTTVDLERFDHQRYRFRQSAGAANALGRIKFMLPNRFDVYLHDTPARAAFEHAYRAVSHGCIRLAEPLRLADYVIDGHPEWSAGELRSAVESGRRETVSLEHEIPVEILYLTAGVDQDGRVRFASDVYGHDEELSRILATLSRDVRGVTSNSADDDELLRAR